MFQLNAGERGRWCQASTHKHNHVSRRESVLEPRPQQDLRPYGRYLSTLNFLSLRHAFAYDVDRGAHRRDHTIDQTHRP